jgi:CxxC motif-containing protein (DUF1111 family)
VHRSTYAVARRPPVGVTRAGLRSVTVIATSLALVAASCSSGSSSLEANLGGDTTRVVDGESAFGFAAPTLTDEERRTFEIGNSFFTQNWVTAPASAEARDGLGPMFNAQACSSCHTRDGRGLPADTVDGNLGLLLRLSIPGASDVGGPKPHPVYGDQLQDRSIVGVPAEGELVITYTEIGGTYADGTAYTLRSPEYTIDAPAFGPLGDDIMISPRLAPQMVGMGLLEAIPEADVVAAADPDDADGDGISGRPNRVWNPATKQTELGRFGWKANAATVEAQTAGAFNGDVGVTSALQPADQCTATQADCVESPNGGDPELSDDRLHSITFYARTLAVPAARDVDDADVRAGAEVFTEMGCASCHSSTFATGDSDVAALTEQTIHPYTDLLLHDMGDGLADDRPDFEATGQEWRTPPLWGVGLITEVNGQRFLLHDGRARTLEEAILWHGGEGEASKEAFRAAEAKVRARLLVFLEAL